MLDTNHCRSLEPAPLGCPPMGDDEEKQGLGTDYDQQAYHSLKEVLQLKLQQRRTREELVSQGIMPPLKSPAAFHEQRRSLERARTEDYLKRKIRSRPERSELVRMHILEETLAEPSLQAKQLQLKRARLADDLNDKISHRPGPIELVHKNILPVPVNCLLDSPKGAGGESSSLDEDSSDALSPDQLANQDSPLGSVSQLSPSDMLNGDMSPTQFVSQPPPLPPLPLLLNGVDSSPQPKMTNGTTTPVASRAATGQSKSHSKSGSDRPPQRPKKAKDTKPKVKKLKYHQYIPPDQKAEREPPPQLDSSYAKILQQQQLFLQLQIINQQQQHYNYHTILPAPPKPPTEQPAAPNPGPSPSRSVPTTTPAPSTQSGASRQNQPPVGGAKPATLPANLDEFKVAELKTELKLRGLTVSGTKNDLIERLRNYQEHNSASTNPAGPKTSQSLPAQSGATHPATSIPGGTSALTHQSTEPMAKVAAFSLAHSVAPGRIMRFGSTSSSPPASPSPSERSLAAMSPDETSCNGDMFGEMVSSPLTQLTLHPSPQHPGPPHPTLPVSPRIKEENHGLLQSSCALSRPPAAAHPPGPGLDPPASHAVDHPSSSSSLDKDQMLQEKDKQIEELTRMLRQKQRLVETLRSQLERGKLGGEAEGAERTGQCAEAQTKAAAPTSSSSALLPQPPTLTNGLTVQVKVEAEEGMEGVLDECQVKRQTQPSQCSQETLFRLQQIHRLQHQQQQIQQQKTEARLLLKQQQQKTEAQMLLQQQQQLQQLIIQQTQQKQLQAQQKLAQLQNQAKAQSLLQAQAKTQQDKTQVQVQGKQAQTPTQAQGQQNQQQTKTPVHVRQVQVHTQIQEAQTLNQVKLSQAQHRRQLKTQRQQQKQQAVTTQQVTPVFISQQNGSQTISLDLLKSQTTPTLVTDGNGNHYLIALTNHSADGQSGVSSLGKTNGRITLQRLQSTPSKLPSQSPPQLPSTDTHPKQPESVSRPIKKGQKAGLHLETNGVPERSLPVSAPPSLQPFFDDVSDSDSQSTTPPSLKREVCPPYDRHTLFTPPSPKRTSSLSTQRPKENGLSSQQMDDLFDILLKSGEISGFRANPDPSLAHHSAPPTPSPPPSPLHLSPPTPPEPALPSQPTTCTGSGRLEDFLESTTGAPLLGVEPGGGLTLIDDLHSQMLSSSSILDHAPSPMDTSDLGFSPHPAEGLDFGDPTLDSMDWLDISMGGGGGGGGEEGTNLAPLGPHTPPSVFSADFLDSTDLQLHWDSCL